MAGRPPLSSADEQALGRHLIAEALERQANQALRDRGAVLSAGEEDDLDRRHRYFRLASPGVAEAVEALARLAPARPVRSLWQGTHAEAIRRARACYDDLAGRLGVAVLDALVENQAFRVETADATSSDPVLGAGRAKRFVLTDRGRRTLVDLGVSVEPSKRRPLVRYCVDWSEQQPHLGGWLGAALLQRFVDLGWVVRAERRVVRITDEGHAGLTERLGARLSD